MTLSSNSGRLRQLEFAAFLLLVVATFASVSTIAQTLTPTPRHVEGPYYKPGTPLRTSLLEQGAPGTRLVLSGRVLSTNGSPVKGAKLDFWQADANGAYDNQNHRFRGHQSTDAAGRYSLETVVPGVYSGRTPHLHVKVEAPSHTALTTQLFIPDYPHNRLDPLYKPGLLMQVSDAPAGKTARFDFVLETVRTR